MRWSVSLAAEGDRELTREEIVELADAVAGHSGIASGIGTTTYAAQVVVEAGDESEALARGAEVFAAAVRRAGLPDWPVSRSEAISEAAEEAAEMAAEAASDHVGFR
jgi:hypothetical protein